jgi:spore coat polysaccharide biosynthesis predicted glycosyltransferase SpsG
MKVLIYKFFNEKEIEDKVAGLVFREKKRATNLRFFCVEEQIRQRLELIGIRSEVIYDFYRTGGADDEASWDKAYQLSDELHASADNDDSLKYSGINFLTLEYNLTPYLLAIKLSNLCKRVAGQDCEILVLVLTKPLSLWMPDINSPKIETVKYADPIDSLRQIRLLRHIWLLFQGALRRPVLGARKTRGLSVQTTRFPKESVTKQKALFVVGSPLYARPAVAISEECLRNGLVPYAATDGLSVTPLFQRHNIEYSVKPRLKPSNLIRILQLLCRLRKHMNSFPMNSKNPVAQSDEFSVSYLCTKILLNDLLVLCYFAIPDIIYLEREIKAKSPDIICPMPDGYFLQQMASALAKKYNIPTLACSAAIETGNARAFMRHLRADKVAAMGQVIKNIYTESGTTPDRIVVTGVAHFDLLFNRSKEQDKQVLLGSDIEPGKRTILFTTDNISLSETQRMLTGVIDAVLKMNDIQLVIKVHPSEDMGPHRAMAEKYRDSRVHVVKDTDLYALISNCELLITKFSTTALEAMMVGKPVVTINLSGHPTPVPYAEEGAAIGVYRYEDIEQAIVKTLYDEETRSKLKAGRDRFVRNWAGEPDGKAAQRIVTLMKEMMASAK